MGVRNRAIFASQVVVEQIALLFPKYLKTKPRVGRLAKKLLLMELVPIAHADSMKWNKPIQN